MQKISYDGYRLPPDIIQQAIWLYLRFTLSFRDVEDLLAERGIAVSYEKVLRWVNHFGPIVAADANDFGGGSSSKVTNAFSGGIGCNRR
jgi:putative transposase